MQSSELVARVDFAEGIPDREVDRHTRDLVRVLGRLDVDDVRPAEGEAEPGTRSADPATIAGIVLVTGALLKPTLSAAVSLVGTWLEQSGQRSVTVELDGAKVTVQGRVAPEHIEAYVRALRGDTGQPGAESAIDGD